MDLGYDDIASRQKLLLLVVNVVALLGGDRVRTE